MSDSWFPPPVTVRLPLSDGQWLLVRRELTWGETEDALARTYSAAADGSLKVNALLVGTAMLLAYLVDWSLEDEEGPVPIRGRGPDEVWQTLRRLRADRLREVRDAVQAHEAAVLETRAQEKKLPATSDGAPTSPSRSAVAGGSTGFVN